MAVSAAEVLRFLVFIVALFARPALATAAQGGPPANDGAAIPLVHSSWLLKDGAPQGAVDIAQTPDGWIWISSPVGLYRFDGVSFTRYQPPAGQTMPISTHRMGVLNDGTLWVTARFGGLYFINGSRFRAFEANKDNFPEGAMGSVLRDADGRIWAASWSGLFALDPGARTWRNMNAALGLPDAPVNHLLIDKAGTMWALDLKAIYARKKGETQFKKVTDKIGWGRLGEAPDGSVWASDTSGTGMRQLQAGHGDLDYEVLKQKQLNAFNFLIDHLGNFWFPKNNEVIRVEFGKKAPSVQKYTTQQGLSGATVNNVFEDREGNVWVLTDSGIDEFRASRMHLLSLPSVFGQAQAVLAGPDGDLWIDNNYFRSIDSAPQPFAPRPAEKDAIIGLYRDPRGGVWYAAVGGLWKLDRNKRVKVALPPELANSPGLSIYALAMDADGGLWVNFDVEAWRYKDGVWQKHGNIPALKALSILSIAATADNAVWFGTLRQNIQILRNGELHEIGVAQGLDVGAVMQIVPHGSDMYISGENGLAVFDGQRAFRLRGEHDEVFPGISGLLIMPDGDLWGNSGVGLIHIGAADIAAVRTDPKRLVHFQRFDENDGLIGTAPPLIPLPSLVRTPGNDLIISTTSGVFRFNPHRAGNEKSKLPVEITGITAAGNTYGPAPGLALSADADSVRIDYTALHFSMPHRVRFRYRLDGFDRDWQEAGTRRSAYYTKLPPGHYTFEVMAANDDGVWSEASEHVAFDIPPTPVQTIWFKVLCLALLLLLGWLLHRLRLHVALRRLAATFEARAAERERIARDLHDTLLQSVQGLILVFGGIAKRVPDAEPIKTTMSNALDLATQVMDEGRNKVSGLRGASDEHNELGASLEHFGRRLANQHMIAFTIRLQGRIRPLRPFIHDEVLMIGREAIQNAFAHASASSVNVELVYGDRTIELAVQDDGRGLDADIGRPGHWGVQGMRERATQLGATLELSTAKDRGTTWRLRVPA